MTRLALLFFLVFSTLCLSAQDTLNRIDPKGRRQGFWRKIDTAGNVIYEGRFRDGKPSGEFRYYYPGGKVKMISVITDEGKRAKTISFYPGGKKMAEGRYMNEKRDSVWLFFGENSDALASQEPYRDGRIEGLVKIFYPDGTPSELQYYKLGVKDGLWEQYYSDGKLRLRGAYKSGDKHGAVKSYYNSGQLMMEGQYLAGHPEGTWTYYDTRGIVQKIEYYEKGVLVKTEPEQH
ncbi:MAG TPA: toxin-antitoxin system YwqK family antitoxin [Bacteroidales bacterium]|nr:toxin-antitoxin system YwqK family antitoxin [Bacteroidales bacterium]HPS61933.1 toxin-antitoxin system YwqK family antitoxin [Bacteroidales bacterium]